MLQRTLRTGLALHARPLDRFVRRARALGGTVQLRFGEKQADGRQVTQLLLLGVPRGAEVTLTVDGPQEADALRDLCEILEQPEAAATACPAEAHAAAFLDGLAGVVPGAPGQGLGRAHRPGRAAASAAASCPAEELKRLERALEAARVTTRGLIKPDDPFSDIFEAQLTLLDDESLAEALRAGPPSGLSAEQTVEKVFADLAVHFGAMGGGFAAERHADVADLRDRLLAALGLAEALTESDQRLVLIVEEATPSRLALLDPERVAGVVSERGGPTSHAAIVARGRGIPLIFAPAAALEGIVEGELLLVDGTRGRLERPGRAVAGAGQSVRTPLPASTEAAGARATAEAPTARTRDGSRIVLRATLGAPGDLAAALRAGAEGCGVLRTELLFAGRRRGPSVEEQARAYARLAKALSPHPLVVRLFDAGSDKPLPFLPTPAGEPNPALGRRGVRLLLDHPAVLEEQLVAIDEARRQSDCEVKALVPMVNDAEELAAVRARCPAELPLGAMVETPAAAILVESLVRDAAFLSVGSNDLAQYVTASDRQRAGAVLHPAVLALLDRVARAAAAAGIECSICGELAGDPVVAPLLCGLGYHCLSVAPAQLPSVRQALASSDLGELRELARTALGRQEPAALAALLAAVRPARQGDDP